MNLNRNTRIIAIIAIFASLYAVLRVLPSLPMVGIGSSFAISDVIAPIYGIVLGPFTGGLSIILGSFLAFAMGKPVVFLFLDFLPAFINAFTLGLLMKRKWLPAVILNAFLLIAFLLNPLTDFFVDAGGFLIPFVWMHIVAFIVLLSPLGRNAGKWINSMKPTLMVAGLAILAFIGTMMQHLMGNILYEVTLNQIYVLLGQTPIVPASGYAATWAVVVFVYPWERLFFIILTVIVGVPIVRILKNNIFLTEKGKDDK